MDQNVTAKSLRILFDEDQRKGGNLEQKFFEPAFSQKKKMAFLKKYYKYIKSRLKSATITEKVFHEKLKRQRILLDARNKQYDKEVTSLLTNIAEKINKKDFRLDLRALPNLVHGKQVYSVDSNPESILAARHTQKIIKELYEIKLASRDLIISQIKNIIFDDFPKLIIKSDISSFYESVNHKILLDQLHSSTKLSVIAKRLITRVIKDYETLSGSDKGLPRGVGISAYLAEIYLSQVDKDLKRSCDLIYYSRYVDDMFLIYAPKRDELSKNYLPELKSTLKKKGLTVNSKTEEIPMLVEQKGSFEYLGYAFKIDGASKKLMLSKKKLLKYRSRLEKSFSDYNAKHHLMKKKSAAELITRVSFLTSNTRLFNRKSNAFVGVYFGNKHINDTSQLSGLDHYLRHLARTISDNRLKARLSRFSFEQGFTKKQFKNFDPKTLSAISRGWQHG